MGTVLAGELALVAVVAAAIRHALGPKPAAATPSVPAQRVGSEAAAATVPASVDPLVDDPLRFAGIPSDAEDLEDTQELPIIRIAEAMAETSQTDIVEAEEAPDKSDAVEPVDEHGRLRRRWARAKAVVRGSAVEAEEAPAQDVEISPDAAEAMAVAQARLSAELSLPGS